MAKLMYYNKDRYTGVNDLMITEVNWEEGYLQAGLYTLKRLNIWEGSCILQSKKIRRHKIQRTAILKRPFFMRNGERHCLDDFEWYPAYLDEVHEG